MPRMLTLPSPRSSLILLGVALLAGAATASAGSVEVVIIADGLEPATLSVTQGTAVSWRNQDDERHRIRSRDGPVEFDSGNLESGESYTFTFAVEGTYPYRDERDDSDTAAVGTVVVGPAVSASGEAAEPGGGEPVAPASSTASVAIADRAFAPQDIVVAAGDTVAWTNADREGHTVSAADGAFDSGILTEGATFSQVFESPGRYEYVCAIHPEMRATVTVAERGGQTAPSEGPPPASSVAPNTEMAVSIADMVYEPARVEVSAGSTVRWTNEDAVVHTVTARDGTFNSGVMKTGDEYSLTFDEPGTYEYFCAIHPLQGGQVVVTDPGP